MRLGAAQRTDFDFLNTYQSNPQERNHKTYIRKRAKSQESYNQKNIKI